MPARGGEGWRAPVPRSLRRRRGLRLRGIGGHEGEGNMPEGLRQHVEGEVALRCRGERAQAAGLLVLVEASLGDDLLLHPLLFLQDVRIVEVERRRCFLAGRTSVPVRGVPDVAGERLVLRGRILKVEGALVARRGRGLAPACPALAGPQRQLGHRWDSHSQRRSHKRFNGVVVQ